MLLYMKRVAKMQPLTKQPKFKSKIIFSILNNTFFKSTKIIIIIIEFIIDRDGVFDGVSIQ